MCESEITIVSNRNKICHFFNHLPNCTSDRLDNCLITAVDDSDLNSASSLIRRSPAVPHSSEGSATISRAANLIKTLPIKTVIQSQLLADYLCKDPHVCNSSVTHSTDDHHQHILHCVFWNSINGKSLWFFQAILIHMYMQGLKTPMSLMQFDFHLPPYLQKGVHWLLMDRFCKKNRF